MTVDDVFELVKFIANKNQNGNITPSSFKRIIGAAQKSYLASLLGNFSTYQPGRPIAKVELGNSATVRQRLNPVIKSASLTITAGKAKFPPDYIQTDAVLTAQNRRIRLSETDRLDSVVNSVIDPVAQAPVYLMDSTGFTFFPSTLTAATLYYVSNPPDIVWAFKPDSNGRPVYDSFNSKQPVWDDVAMLDIVARALRLIGVNLSAPEVSNYATEIKFQGQ